METIDLFEKIQLPKRFREDLTTAIEILKKEGCTEVYLFGSLATNEFHEKSDIDLAVRGCPKGKFFHVLGKLLMTLHHSVDLVDLDYRDSFARFLEKEGDLVRIG